MPRAHEKTYLAVVTTAGLLSFLASPLSSLEDDGLSMPCQNGEYLLLQTKTCTPCPDNCSECLPRATNTSYPCRSCNQPYGLIQAPTGNTSPNHSKPAEEASLHWTLGGTCEHCRESGRVTSAGNGRLRLNVVGAKQEVGYALEGRLEVKLDDRWGAVCDDAWGMSNSAVVCKQLGLGAAVGFDARYDLLHPYLPQMPMLMDDVKCSGMEESIFDCAFLGPVSQNCRPTETVGVRCSGPELRGPLCLDHCPKGQFYDVTTTACSDCASRCLACEGTAYRCTACLEPYYLNQPAACTQTCPTGHYGNNISRRCERCPLGCRSCVTAISGPRCTSCASGQGLFEGACVTNCPADAFLVDAVPDVKVATCRRTCPKGYYRPPEGGSSCLQCVGKCLDCRGSSGNCTECRVPMVLQPTETPRGRALNSYTSGHPPSSSCRPRCSSGFYPDAEGHCVRCHSANCTACFRGGHLCASCQRGFLLHLGQCVVSCPSGLYQVDGECSFPCGDGFYADQSASGGGVCKACGPSCRSCLSPEICIGCYGGSFLRNNTCVKECGSGYLTITYPRRGEVRLLGGPTALEGAVEIYINGLWRQVCVDGANLPPDVAKTICTDMQMGSTLLITTDGRFSTSQTNLTSSLRCYGNETSIVDCEYAIGSCSVTETLAVHCSSPDLSRINECHVINTESCDRQPCAAGVHCEDLPSGGSHCPPCARQGPRDPCVSNSVTTGSTALPDFRLLFPSRPQSVDMWPENEQLTLPVVTNLPLYMLTFSWSRDGEEISTGPDYRIEEWGALTLLSPKGHKMSGLYSCDIVSPRGNLTASYMLSIQESVELTEYPESQSVGWRGATLTCQGRGHPPPNVTWIKDGLAIQSNSIEQTPQGTLILRDLKESDAGSYKCILTNGLTKATATARITVNAPARIMKKSPYTSAVQGTPFSLVCDAVGGPKPRIYWKVNDEDLPQTTRITVNDTTVIFSEIQEEDEGLYLCVAENDEGSDEWRTNLVILVPPKVEASPEGLVVAIGANVKFGCNATGRPAPVVRWYMPDGSAAVAEMETESANDTNSRRSVLSFVSVETQHGGLLTCEAENYAGKMQVSVNLTVLGPPRWKLEPQDWWALDGWIATLRWMAWASPPANIVWFKDGVELQASKRYSITGDGMSFVCEYPADSGSYTLQASNRLGTIVGTAHLQAVRNFPPLEVHHVASTNVTLHAGNLPSHVTGGMFEVLVVLAGFNETRENLTISPLEIASSASALHLDYNGTDIATGYTALVFDRLPRLLTIGDGKRYVSAIGKRSVRNFALKAHGWYVVAVRMVKYIGGGQGDLGPPWGANRFPVGATEYTEIHMIPRRQAPALKMISDDTLHVVSEVILGIALCAFMVLVAFILFYWRRTGHSPCLNFHQLVVWGRALKERTMTSDYVTKFSPHPESGQFKPGPLGGEPGTSSETVSTSVSTVYIPTEDEIEPLESIGIHYYENDNWIRRAPLGVLDTNQTNERHPKGSVGRDPKSNHLSPDNPRPPTTGVTQTEKLFRVASDPLIPVTGSCSTTAPVERTHSDPTLGACDDMLPGLVLGEVLVPPELCEQVANKESAGVSTEQLELSFETSTGNRQREIGQPGDGLETDVQATKMSRTGSLLQWRRMLPSRSRQSTITLGKESLWDVEAVGGSTQRILRRDKRRRPKLKYFRMWRDRGLRSLRSRGSHLLSRGRSLAKRVLDRHDVYGVQPPADSDGSSDEARTTQHAPNAASTASTKNILRPSKSASWRRGLQPKCPAPKAVDGSSKGSSSDTGSADCVYIDPSSIVSIPMRKIPASGRATAKATIKAIRSFPGAERQVVEPGMPGSGGSAHDLAFFTPRSETNSASPQPGPSGLSWSRSGVGTVGDGTVSRGIAAELLESPVKIKRIGKLRHRKDAEVQTDSDLEDDTDAVDPIAVDPSDSPTGLQADQDVIQKGATVLSEVGTQQGSRVADRLSTKTLPGSYTPNQEAACSKSSEAAPALPPRPAESLPPAIFHTRDSSNDSDQYLTLIESIESGKESRDLTGSPSQERSTEKSEEKSKNETEAEEEEDDAKTTDSCLYQSLSSFDSTPSPPVNVGEYDSTSNFEQKDDDLENVVEDGAIPCFVHNDSIHVSKNSPHRISHRRRWDSKNRNQSNDDFVAIPTQLGPPIGDDLRKQVEETFLDHEGTNIAGVSEKEGTKGEERGGNLLQEGVGLIAGKNKEKREDLKSETSNDLLTADDTVDIQAVIKNQIPNKLIIPDVFLK